MKYIGYSLALILVLVPCLSARAADPGSDTSRPGNWTGLFVGGDLGISVTESGVTQSGITYNFPTNPAFTIGFEYGFLYELPIKLVLGVDGYGNFNFASNNSVRIGRNNIISSNFGTNAFGGDLRIGYDLGRLLPYAMIGGGIIEGTSDASNLDGSGVHAGLGVNYLVARYVGLFGEWSIQQASANAASLGFPNGTAGFLINNIVGGVSFYLWIPGMNGPY